MLAISISKGRKNPFAKAASVENNGTALAAWLNAIPPEKEGWISLHSWAGNHRKAEKWTSAAGVAIDLDYLDEQAKHVTPPQDHRDHLVASGLPGTAFHHTPRGARVFFLFEELCTDREAWAVAARAACTQVTTCLRTAQVPGYAVDEGASNDFARLMFAPRAIIDGVERNDIVVCLRHQPYLLSELRPPQAARPRLAPASDIKEATERWNKDHPREYPRDTGDCPACGHSDCFGTLKGDSSRWSCFSSNHDEKVGVRGQGCFHGDALDLDAHAAGMGPSQLLRREGYLVGSAPVPTDTGALELVKSYASLCAILRGDQRILPEPLEFNEMALCATIGGRPVEDSDIGILRERIERLVPDRKGKPLRFGVQDIEQALQQVAHEHTYHPVRDYLQELHWDGVPRINSVVEDIFGCPATTLNVSMLRCWAISCVARAMRPGCKVDTVLILQGPQGYLKSTFFAALAGEPYFADTPMDLSNKDSMMGLRRTWVYEWPELETLQRARSYNAVKAFLSSRIDTFRPPYSRNVVAVPRSCVIVGTANDDDFLTDPTGNRRYWVLAVRQTIDQQLVAAMRDQFWAEARVAFEAGENWWLPDDLSHALSESQEAFQGIHPWELLIKAWLVGKEEVSTTDVLEQCLRKPAERWSRFDSMQISSVLKSLGWTQGRKSRSAGRARAWFRTPPQPWLPGSE